MGYTEDGKRQRRKVSGTAKAAVMDRLKDLHKELAAEEGPGAMTANGNMPMSSCLHVRREVGPLALAMGNDIFDSSYSASASVLWLVAWRGCWLLVAARNERAAIPAGADGTRLKFLRRLRGHASGLL